MAVNSTVFRLLDETLSASLLGTFLAESTKNTGRLIEALKLRDEGAAIDIVSEFSFDIPIARHKKQIVFIGTASVLFGASRLGSGQDAKNILKNPETAEILEIATTLLERILRENALQAFKSGLNAFVTRFFAFEKRTQDKAFKADISGPILLDPTKFTKTQVASLSRRQLQAAASLHTSRMAQFGFLQLANTKKITVYKVNEEIDQRTCPVCLFMNGKTFRVEETRSVFNQLIRTSDPETLKALSVFPSQSKDGIARLRGLGREGLIKAGITAPPFHPLCRGFLDQTTTVIPVPVSLPVAPRPKIKPKRKPISAERLLVNKKIKLGKKLGFGKGGELAGIDTLIDHMRVGRKANKEFASFIDYKTGELNQRVKGKKRSVEITQRVIGTSDEVWKSGGALHVHNHPNDGPPSSQDLAMMQFTRTEIIVGNAGSLYRLEAKINPATGSFYSANVYASMKRQFNKEIKKFKKEWFALLAERRVKKLPMFTAKEAERRWFLLYNERLLKFMKQKNTIIFDGKGNQVLHGDTLKYEKLKENLLDFI